MACKNRKEKISPVLTVANSVDCRGGGVCDSSLRLIVSVGQEICRPVDGVVAIELEKIK